MLPSSTARVDWRDFQAIEPKLAEMQAAAQRLADEMKSRMPARWLTLTGWPGVGKTHLAKCLWRWFDDRGCFYTEPKTGARLARSGSFAKWRSVAADIRGGDWRLMDDLAGRYFLVLDDIGAEHQGGSGVVHSALERLLDDRVGKWTVITSNLMEVEIAEQLGARVASRLHREGNLVVDASGVRDFNQRPRKEAA